jgi:hypothetical protein
MIPLRSELRIGSHREPPEDYRDAFDEWSSHGDNYEGRHDALSNWKYGEQSEVGRPRAIGSLFRYARDVYGWDVREACQRLGLPAEQWIAGQRVYSPLHNKEEARRLWRAMARGNDLPQLISARAPNGNLTEGEAPQSTVPVHADPRPPSEPQAGETFWNEPVEAQKQDEFALGDSALGVIEALEGK